MGRYFDDNEIRSRKERNDDCNQKLREMVKLGYERSRRVTEAFKERGLKPSDISTVEDLGKLSVISREEVIDFELREPPFGGFSGDDIKAERIFISPGPVYEPHLKEYSLWGRGYKAAGFSEDDIVINTFSYHMVAAGLTFHEGLRSTGATVVPSGTTGTEAQVHLIRDLGITGYTGTPSFLKAIIDKAEEMGYSLKSDFGLRRAVFVAEPLQASLREVFEQDYGIDTYQMYGATEVGDIAYECSEKNGWHICEDVIVEIVDPVSGMPVENSLLGEVVVTRLNDKFFLFRFGTGDLSSIKKEACSCGRTSLRLNGIAGRAGDAVKVRGLFIAPSQLYKIKEVFKGLKFQLIITRDDYRDHLAVAIESTGTGDDSNLIDRFESHFRDICTVKIDKIELIEPGALPEEGKLIVDRREWK
jgi:phenylacetate-CoA ligase